MLEEALASLQTAVEELTATIKGKKQPAAAAEEPEKPRRARGKKEAPALTLENVREAMMALNEAKGKDAVVQVLSAFGVRKLGDLPEENFQECIDDANKAAAEEDNSGGDDELFN